MPVSEKALTELTDISSQVRAAVLLEADGNVLASTLPDEQGEDLAVAARMLLEQAEIVRADDEAQLTQLEAATGTGSVFVVRDGGQILAAVTAPDPTAGLVFYDLRACLRGAGEKPKRRRAPAKKPAAKKEKADGAS